jgi:UDP-N-acetylmuramate dehydrogenase
MVVQEFALHAIHEQHHLRLIHDVELREHSTMRIGGSANFFAEVYSTADVRCAYIWAAEHNIPVTMIGSGSNIVWTDLGYAGLILRNHIRAFKIVSQGNGFTELHLGSGEILDEVVERTTQMHLTGMEYLSLIPGTCGGAILQNSGAYGQEISQTLVSVDVYDATTQKVIVLPKDVCNLSYRSSIFKYKESGRYAILGITVRLRRDHAQIPSHPALLASLCGKDRCSPADARSAVSRIRNSRLPDPATFPNCGSFFTNPIVSREDYASLSSGVIIPYQEVDGQRVKIPAAWLLEQCGFRDYSNAELGFGTWVGQPIVVFATRLASCKDLLQFSGLIKKAIAERFGIVLEQEPEVIGTL